MFLWFFVIGLLVAVVITGSLVWVVMVRRLLFANPSIPGPRPIPIIGNILIALQMRLNSLKMNMKLQESGGLVKFFLCHRGVVMAASPLHLRVALTHPECGDRPPELALMAQPIFGESSVMVSNGDVWRQARHLTASALNSISQSTLVRIMMSKFSDLAEELEPYADKQAFAIKAVLSRVTSVAVLRADASENLKDEFLMERVVDFDQILEIVYKRCYSPIHFFEATFDMTEDGRVYKQAVEHTERLASEVLDQVEQERKECKATGSNHPNTFLHNYLEICGEATRDEKISQIRTVYGASVATVNQIGFVILMIAIHPGVQDRLFEEDRVALSESADGQSDLHKYKYLTRVIKETLRLYPQAHTGVRFTTDDVNFGEYLVPKGTIVMVNFFHAQRNEKYFEDPLKFNPDRFSDEEKLIPFSFLPFGAGKRVCPGKKFAMTMMKCAVISIIRHFRIFSEYKSVAEVDSNLGGTISLSDVNDFRIKLRRRRNES